MKSIFCAALLALALLHPSADAGAAESYDACTGTITAIPFTISTPGTWCLKHDLSVGFYPGGGITVNSSHVTIDCNGFGLDASQVGNDAPNRGILAVDRSHVIVRNCTIRGFQYGIALLGQSGGHHRVEHNRLDGNTSYGIFVEGDGSLVRDNHVALTGGSTLTPNAYGIFGRHAVDIVDNVVSDVHGNGAQGNIIGIYALDNAGGNVSDNRVQGLVKAGNIGLRGILSMQSSRVTMANNIVAGDGSSAGVGISCTDAATRVLGSVVSGFPTGLAACGEAGRNDIVAVP
jgi:hypothetical protein